ncbi:unnamed protein product [Linum tenue]|uniref:Uncharacterized protein n=1 Tax=Linum tenue TaxID=586396 RepID=A0AAV0HNH2_9ROSI|nr:unnamed protein product [Linum tenue]
MTSSPERICSISRDKSEVLGSASRIGREEIHIKFRRSLLMISSSFSADSW